MDAAQRVARLCCWLGHVGFLPLFLLSFYFLLLLLFVESVRYDTKGKQTSILAECFIFVLLNGPSVCLKSGALVVVLIACMGFEILIMQASMQLFA